MDRQGILPDTQARVHQYWILQFPDLTEQIRLVFKMPVDCTRVTPAAFAISPSEVDDTPCVRKDVEPHRGCVGAFLALLVGFSCHMFVNLQALDLHTFVMYVP